jgi:hypothetical protein
MGASTRLDTGARRAHRLLSVAGMKSFVAWLALSGCFYGDTPAGKSKAYALDTGVVIAGLAATAAAGAYAESGAHDPSPDGDGRVVGGTYGIVAGIIAVLGGLTGMVINSAVACADQIACSANQ